MAKSRQVTIQFLGDAKGLISAANSGSKATTTLGDKLKKVGKAAVIGFAGAAVVAGKAMYDMAEAAIEDEKSAALLANTLRNTTSATKAQVASVEDWISKQGELYGVTDDDLRPALAKLATATGDITKAQKLASLAMDVSAGTGKDLSSISLALAKAQNGSLAGLGRLGVATKDAAGQTKTLAEITDDLSKKYAGSASKAAETASGKFQRLKVDLAETGEAIGYKLLPYADDLGSWLLKDGVPAVEGFAHSFKQELGPVLRDAKTWVSDNKDELHDLGGQIVNVVIPAISDLAGIAGDAFQWFSKLPGPIKELGIEAGAAAVVVPKLSGAMSGLGLPSFSTQLDKTATKMERVGAAAKMAGGVAGLALLADSTQRTSKAMGTLEGAAGGALAGFAVGGPIGAGLGALAGAELALVSATDEVKSSYHMASPQAADFADQLNKVSGAATNAARNTAALALQQSGALEAGRALGLSSKDLVKYIFGNEAAIRKVNAALQAGTKESISWTDQYGQTHTVLSGNSAAANKLSTALVRNSSAFEENRKKAQELAIAGGDLSRALKGVQDRSKIVSEFETKGYPETKRELAEILAQYKLTPKQVATVIKATGVDASVSAVQKLIDHINTLHDKTVTVTTVTVNKRGGVTSSAGGHSSNGASRSATGSAGNVLQGNFGGKAGYGQSLLDSYAGAGRKAEVAGNALLNGIVRGLKKGERTLKNVMQGLQSYIQTKTDKLNEILSDRASFVESFRSAFSESIFSAQNTDADGNSIAPTLASMKAFAQQQQAQAHALAANIKSLLAKGLSRDMIQQLVSQGASGVQQIAALATGTAQDIADFNAVNQDINATLNGLGTDLFNALNPNAEAQIAALNAQIAQGERSIAALQAIADKLDKGDKIQIKGSDLVILLRAVERQTGQRLFVASA